MIPRGILESDDYQELDAEQQRNFSARIQYLAEIQEGIEGWLNVPGVSILEFADDLELDVLQVLSISVEHERQPSIWLLHSSWTFDTSASEMLNVLPAEIRFALDEAFPSIECDVQTLIDWLRRRNSILKSLLVRFQEATTYPEAIALSLALDVIFSGLAAVLVKVRFNPNI